MLRIGLTGGIASGKTTVAKRFADKGATVIDTDRIAREVVEPGMPALAAQRVEYLELVLEAYRTGARKSQAMAAMSNMLTPENIRDLATHYSRQKARSVIYVVLPAAK